MTTRVSIVKSMDRAYAVGRAIDLIGINPVKGLDVFVKPNFNTADEFPASTHNDTLRHLVLKLREMGAANMTVGDRSGPADTEDVIREKGVDALCRELGVGLMNFDSLKPGDWVHMNPPGNHWFKGFHFARPVVESPCVVTTCCLKTHGFGGVFTMSLKLSIGMVRRSNMTELHSSLKSMRKMIAEANTAYSPALVLMDGLKAFIDRGPMTGPLVSPGLMAAGTDRVAVDAVGLAVLRLSGANKAVTGRPVFEQEQIARAVELGLGVAGADEIELVPDDDNESKRLAEQIMRELRA